MNVRRATTAMVGGLVVAVASGCSSAGADGSHGAGMAPGCNGPTVVSAGLSLVAAPSSDTVSGWHIDPKGNKVTAVEFVITRPDVAPGTEVAEPGAKGVLVRSTLPSPTATTAKLAWSGLAPGTYPLLAVISFTPRCGGGLGTAIQSLGGLPIG